MHTRLFSILCPLAEADRAWLDSLTTIEPSHFLQLSLRSSVVTDIRHAQLDFASLFLSTLSITMQRSYAEAENHNTEQSNDDRNERSNNRKAEILEVEVEVSEPGVLYLVVKSVCSSVDAPKDHYLKLAKIVLEGGQGLRSLPKPKMGFHARRLYFHRSREPIIEVPIRSSMKRTMLFMALTAFLTGSMIWRSSVSCPLTSAILT